MWCCEARSEDFCLGIVHAVAMGMCYSMRRSYMCRINEDVDHASKVAGLVGSQAAAVRRPY